MDWNYLYSVVAFVIGGLAGFQGVYERYKKDSPKAAITLPGFFSKSYRYKLSYLIINHVGRKGFKTLLSS